MNTTKAKFTTKHLIALLSMIMAGWLFVLGIISPDGFIMSFSSAGLVHTLLRATVVTGLIIVLLSRPPRSIATRIFLGALSAVLTAGSLAAMVDYQIGFLDIALYGEVAILLLLEAIEKQTSAVTFKQKKPVTN
jgi:hypothetical protein